MDITHPAIEAYLYELLPAQDSVLQEMERLAAKQRFPIVGPLVGRLLAQMARISGAQRVFECGSGFGYSAYWFATGMSGKGTVVFTDDEPENAMLAAGFFKKGEIEHQMQIEVGDALEIIDRQDGLFDIVFVDCEKARYPLAFEKALPKLRPGGLLIADNVLWFGQVLQRSEEPSVIGIQRFNQLIAADPQLMTTIVPLRDGVSISLKR